STHSFSSSAPPLALPSFPTRRSSDLQLLRESTLIFLERAPRDADPESIGRALVGEQDVVEVHDLHVWTVTSGFPAFSAHVLVERSEEHTSELQSRGHLVCRLLLEKKK